MRPMPLADKAACFERRVVERHHRLGFVSSSRFDRPGDLTSNRLDPKDNEGLWTAMYAAAECFRYAATKWSAGRALPSFTSPFASLHISQPLTPLTESQFLVQARRLRNWFLIDSADWQQKSALWGTPILTWREAC